MCTSKKTLCAERASQDVYKRQNSGIGYRLSYSRGLLRSDAVILCMLVIGLVGILMDKLLTALFRRLLPWQKKA